MFNEKRKLYILDIFGEISASQSKSLSSKTTNMSKVIKFLHKVELDGPEKVAGILLRLNTPGGTTGTSEEVATMIGKVRQVGIPIVASIADICCSGGYWIASSCDYIFANKTSMTGSVGVILQIPNFKGLSEKLGVQYITIKSGKMKDIGNPFRELSDEEEMFLKEHAKESHDIFINEVVKNRNLSSINPDLFDGRPFSAVFAKENNLIDEIGTFYDALNYLLEEVNETEDTVKIKSAIKGEGFISRIFSAESDIITSVVQKLFSVNQPIIK